MLSSLAERGCTSVLAPWRHGTEIWRGGVEEMVGDINRTCSSMVGTGQTENKKEHLGGTSLTRDLWTSWEPLWVVIRGRGILLKIKIGRAGLTQVGAEVFTEQKL